MSYLHRDIVENIIIHSDMKEVEMLCGSNKEIGDYCNDKRIWHILVEKHHIKLFKDLNKIKNYKELMEEYKVYKKYELQAMKIIAYAKSINRYVFIPLELTAKMKANLLDFIYNNTYKESWFGYGTGYKISVNLLEILFDFNLEYVILLYDNHGITEQVVFKRSDDRMLNLLTGILYFFPTVDLKLGHPYGGIRLVPTNVRMKAYVGDELSVVRKNLIYEFNLLNTTDADEEKMSFIQSMLTQL